MECSEPWDAVRVRVAVSRDIAARLRQLTRQCDPALRGLGVLSVRVGGAGGVLDNVGASLSEVSSAASSRNNSTTGAVQPPLTSAFSSHLSLPAHPAPHHHHHHQPLPSHPHHHPLHLQSHPHLQQQQQQRLVSSGGSVLHQRVQPVPRTAPPPRHLHHQHHPHHQQQQQMAYYCESPVPPSAVGSSTGSNGLEEAQAPSTVDVLAPPQTLGSTAGAVGSVGSGNGVLLNGVLTHGPMSAVSTRLPVAAVARVSTPALHHTPPSLQRPQHRHMAVPGVPCQLSPPPPYPGGPSSAPSPASVVPVSSVAAPALSSVSPAAVGSPLLVNLLKSDVSPLDNNNGSAAATAAAVAGFSRGAVRSAAAVSSVTTTTIASSAVIPSSLHQQLLRSRLQHPSVAATGSVSQSQPTPSPSPVAAAVGGASVATATSTSHRVYSAHLFQLRRGGGSGQVRRSDSPGQQQQQLRLAQVPVGSSVGRLPVSSSEGLVGDSARCGVSLGVATVSAGAGDRTTQAALLSSSSSSCLASTLTATTISTIPCLSAIGSRDTAGVSVPISSAVAATSVLPAALSSHVALSTSSSVVCQSSATTVSGKPCQLLINPLTGLLEPMAASDESESELELPTAANKIDGATSTISASRLSVATSEGTVTTTAVSYHDTPATAAVSIASAGSTRLDGPAGGDGGDFRVRLKIDKLDTSTLACDTSSVVSSSVPACVSTKAAAVVSTTTAISACPSPLMNGADTALARPGGGAEQRVPPLHISLRGGHGNAAVVVSMTTTLSTAPPCTTGGFRMSVAASPDVSVSSLLHPQSQQRASGRGGKSRTISRVLCASDCVGGDDGSDNVASVKSTVSVGVDSNSVCAVATAASAMRNRCVRDKLKRQKKRDTDEGGTAEQQQQLTCNVVDSLVESNRVAVTNHILDLHSEMDLKHVPPMPPEDIFSPDAWLTPGQSSTDALVDSFNGINDALGPESDALAACRIGTSLSPKHTDLQPVSAATLPAAVISRTAAAIGVSAVGVPSSSSAAAGGGDDSGIESMDTQSEESPNQSGESPQHRKEELDSEKHESGMLSRQLQLLGGRRSVSVDEVDLPASQRQINASASAVPAGSHTVVTAGVSSALSPSLLASVRPGVGVSVGASWTSQSLVDRLNPAVVAVTPASLESRDHKVTQVSVSSSSKLLVHSPALSALLSSPLLPTVLSSSSSRLSVSSGSTCSGTVTTATVPLVAGVVATLSNSSVNTGCDRVVSSSSTVSTLSLASATIPTTAAKPTVVASSVLDRLSLCSVSMTTGTTSANSLSQTNVPIVTLSSSVSSQHSVCTSVITSAGGLVLAGSQCQPVASGVCTATAVGDSLLATTAFSDVPKSVGSAAVTGDLVPAITASAGRDTVNWSSTGTLTGSNESALLIETPVTDSIAVPGKSDIIGDVIGEPVTSADTNSSSSVITGDFCVVAQSTCTPAMTTAVCGAISQTPLAQHCAVSGGGGAVRSFTAAAAPSSSSCGSTCASPVPPLTLPPGVKMLPIKLIKAPAVVVATTGPAACSVGSGLAASAAVTSSSAPASFVAQPVTGSTCSRVGGLSVSIAECTAVNTSAVVTASLTSSISSESTESTAKVSSGSASECDSIGSRLTPGDCPPPSTVSSAVSSAVSSVEPESLRVQPPLYTYSNAERTQRCVTPPDEELLLSGLSESVCESDTSSTSPSGGGDTCCHAVSESIDSAISDVAISGSVDTASDSVKTSPGNETTPGFVSSTPDNDTTSSSVKACPASVTSASFDASSDDATTCGFTKTSPSDVKTSSSTKTSPANVINSDSDINCAVTSAPSNVSTISDDVTTAATSSCGSANATTTTSSATSSVITSAPVSIQSGDVERRCTRSATSRLHCVTTTSTATTTAVAMPTTVNARSSVTRALRSHTDTPASTETVTNCIDSSSIAINSVSETGAHANITQSQPIQSEDDTTGIRVQVNGTTSSVPATTTLFSVRPSVAGTGSRGVKREVSTVLETSTEDERPSTRSSTDLSTITSSASTITPPTSCLGDTDSSGCSGLSNSSAQTASDGDGRELTGNSCVSNDTSSDHQALPVVPASRHNSTASNAVGVDSAVVGVQASVDETALVRDDNHVDTAVSQSRNNNSTKTATPISRQSRAKSRVAKIQPVVQSDPFSTRSSPVPPPLAATAAVTRRGRALLARKQQQQQGADEGGLDGLASGGVSVVAPIVPGKRKLRNNSQLPVVVANNALDSVAEINLSAKRRRSSRDK